MMKLTAIALAAVFAGGLLLEGSDRSGARAATTEPGPTSGEAERFTTYRAPTGPELTAAQAQARAVEFARRAGQLSALTLMTAHATLAQAHVVLMGEGLAEAQADESGPAERAEEMRSPVWVTMVTAPAGEVFEPNDPAPRGHTAPSGKVLVVVADAHTGFVKEEYLGPTAPDIGLLGPTTTASVPAQAAAQEAQTAAVGTHFNVKQGIIAGRLSPPRVRWPVSVANARHRRLATERSLPAGAETRAGEFSFRELEGTYTVSAPRCGSLRVKVRRRRETHITLHCK